jgi:hypothetical protein
MITTEVQTTSKLMRTILFMADNSEAGEVASSGAMFITSSLQYTDCFKAY